MTPEEKQADEDRLVTVCANCNQACCWHGEFLCEEARVSGTVELPVSKLRELALENPIYWEEGR